MTSALVEPAWHIRPMIAADCDAVLQLWASCEGLGDCGSRDDFVRFLERNPGLSPVAMLGEQMIGAVQCGEDGHRGYLYHLAVAAEHRQSGIAAALIEWCLVRLAARHIRRCSIFLYADNRLGESFWRRTGWRERTDLKVFARDIGKS